MPKSAASTFDRCQKVLGYLDNHSRIEADQKSSVTEAYELLREYRRALDNGVNQYFDIIQTALEAVHANGRYSEDEMIRDLSDICETLRQAADARFRKDRTKIFIARAFLQQLRNELRALD